MHSSFRFFPALVLSCFIVAGSNGQTTSVSDNASPADETPVTLDKFTVTETLNRAREDIVPSLGATSYELTSNQILAQAQGADASFNDVLLRVPGVAQDSGNQVHLRGEHANL